jgi:hypothetical protein
VPRHTRTTVCAARSRRHTADERALAHVAYRVGVARLRAVRSGEPLSRRSVHPGVVVWARIGFREIDGFKVRPALVVDRAAGNALLLPVSSLRPGRRLVELPEPLTLLPRPSGIAPRLVEVEHGALLTVVGELSEVNTAFACGVAATLDAVTSSRAV